MRSTATLEAGNVAALSQVCLFISKIYAIAPRFIYSMGYFVGYSNEPVAALNLFTNISNHPRVLPISGEF